MVGEKEDRLSKTVSREGGNHGTENCSDLCNVCLMDKGELLFNAMSYSTVSEVSIDGW